ncbi:G-patch domain and KOW motifs-containing protein [Tachyglossus aculeatus]|uniref:G-patch domain and KOW motifs-containing protein n=1 Tax=Tachyglossus aculeatus TaxID=9261 RepID=UPI0018F4F5E0|nr:G-patch domain and KOW motifs-containing protein [Tachyglossus aculeatus]
MADDVDNNNHDGGTTAVLGPAAPVSFSFTRTAPRKRVLEPKGGEDREEEEEEEEEKDFLKAVERNQLQSVKPVETPKELIIPLIKSNQWRKPAPAPAVQKGSKPPPPEDGVLTQAVKEIIEESKKSLEERENGPQVDPNLAIPLLMQNRVPDGFEDGDKVDVSLRPESATEADYEVVPVEAYGIAMLRGMGWKAGEGIGRTFKQDVKPQENQLRPKGLGLGADRAAVEKLAPRVPGRRPRPGDKRPAGQEEEEEEGESQRLAPGVAVLILSGPHKELYGKVEGLDPDNARVMVRLAVGGHTVTISEYVLKPVSQKEFDSNATDLTRLSRPSPEQRNGIDRRPRGGSPSVWREDKDLKRRPSPDRAAGAKSKESGPAGVTGKEGGPAGSSRTPHWLQRDLRVRFVDKLYKAGRYYNCKMIIEDVVSPDTCVCRTEDGRVLEGVKEAMLETLIPKGEDNWIMVVSGQFSGRLGRILRRDRERSRALVQLQRDEEGPVLKLDYDAICHYVGHVDED